MSKSTKNVLRKDFIKARISKMIKNGRKEITTKEELEEFSIGSLISYITNNNIFKPGGFIIDFADDYFIYITHDFLQKYRIRYINIKKMWAGDPFIVTNDIVSLVKSSQKKTNFPVKIGDITVYYGQKNFDKDRFRNTDKYQLYLKWYNYFIDPDYVDDHQ